jgi:FKBP-type peptidyl-prolyl cis-trans isomerase SlyD
MPRETGPGLENMIQEQGTFVSIVYTLRLESGEIVKGNPAKSLEHMTFITGYNQVLPGLERRLLGLRQGENVEIVVPAKEAFGESDPELVVEKTFEEFPQGRNLNPGRWVLAKNPEHRVSFGYYVREKRPKSVVLDYNHPLAGKSLHYTIQIIEARPATREELAMVKPCEYASETGVIEK